MIMMEPVNCHILLVDDEEGIRFTLGALLKKEGYQVDVASGHLDAVVCLQAANYDLAFVDIMLAGESGIDLLRDIRLISPSTQVVVFTGRPEVKTAAEAVRLGAFDYITKPIQAKTLITVCQLALTAKKMRDDKEKYRANLDAIFRSISDAIIMIDKEERLVHFNAAAGSLCGYTSDLIGGKVEEFRHGCGGGCRTTLLETVRTNTPKELRRFECRMPDSKFNVINFRSTPITEANGTVNGAVMVIRDETPMVDLERSLKKRAQFYGIIGNSDPMQRLYSLIEALANVPTTVLINGESGTGKELVAAALHYAGGRAKGPFVKVNCSALSESLLESELFGHVRGAFTGAIAEKVGRFQKANHGTLFLDEIGDISPAVQMRLLRVLQESEFERVGESTPIKVDVRIIAATNKNLAEMVSQGMFRQDLYYRLNVVRMELPALRARYDDIGLLAGHFLSKFNHKFSKSIQTFSDEILELFRSHTWPGNVRELEHAVEYAVILNKDDVITVSDLPQDLIDAVLGANTSTTDQISSPRDKLSLDEALAMCDGNITRTARLLGISRPTVYRHMKEELEQL